MCLWNSLLVSTSVLKINETSWMEQMYSQRVLLPQPFGSNVLLYDLLGQVLLGIFLNCLLFLHHFNRAWPYVRSQISQIALASMAQRGALDPNDWGSQFNAQLCGNILLQDSFSETCDVNIANIDNSVCSWKSNNLQTFPFWIQMVLFTYFSSKIQKKKSLANFLSEEKSVSRQIVLTMIRRSSKIVQWTEAMLSKLATFPELNPLELNRRKSLTPTV